MAPPESVRSEVLEYSFEDAIPAADYRQWANKFVILGAMDGGDAVAWPWRAAPDGSIVELSRRASFRTHNTFEI